MKTDMTKGSPFRLIMKFLIPVVIGNICQQLYNTVDSNAIRFRSFSGVCYAEGVAWLSAAVMLAVSYLIVMRRYPGGILHRL